MSYLCRVMEKAIQETVLRLAGQSTAMQLMECTSIGHLGLTSCSVDCVYIDFNLKELLIWSVTVNYL